LPKYPRLRPAGPPAEGGEGAASSDQTCEWLNNLVSIVWPRIDTFLKNLVETQIQPSIDQALPHIMKGAVKIQRCSVGKASPSFSNFKVRERKDKAIILDIDVDVTSDLDVQIRAMRVPLGVQQFIFRGVLTVVLRPYSEKPPFFGGIEVYFVDPPELGFDFTGAANVADINVVKATIQSVILGQLKQLLVVPARIAIDLDPDDRVDDTMLKFPEPVGVLRVLLKSGKGLRAEDFSFTGQRTSDPYVVIEVGQETWKSPVLHKTTNPTWIHENVQDFFVYETEQKANFNVFDEDRFNADDLLGCARNISIEHFAKGGQVMEESLPLLFEEEPAGTLDISTRWFCFTDQVPVTGIPPAVARGPNQLFLCARIIDAHKFSSDMEPPYVLHIIVGPDLLEPRSKEPKYKYEMSTKPSVPPADVDTADHDLAKVCRKLSHRGMAEPEIVDVTGLLPAQVHMIIRNDRNPDAAAAATKELKRKRAAEHPCFNQIVRLLLPWTEEITTKNICLELRDRLNRQVGERFEVPLAEAVGKEVNGPFSIMPGVALRGTLSTKWLTLP